MYFLFLSRNRNVIDLFIAEFRRKWIEFLRYPTEVAVTIAVFVLLFYGLLLGATYMAGEQPLFGKRLDNVIVGYIVWAMALNSLGSVANEMMRDTQVGALEQVLMSAYGPLSVFVARAVSEALLHLLVILAVLFPILFLAGRWLEFSITTVVPLGSIILSSLGLAFLMGAAAIRFKKTQQLLVLGQFLLLFVVMTPFETWDGLAQQARFFLPMASGVGLLRDQLVRGLGIDWLATVAAYGSGFLYMMIGFLVFRHSMWKAKVRGSLGWY